MFVITTIDSWWLFQTSTIPLICLLLLLSPCFWPRHSLAVTVSRVTAIALKAMKEIYATFPARTPRLASGASRPVIVWTAQCVITSAGSANVQMDILERGESWWSKMTSDTEFFKWFTALSLWSMCQRPLSLIFIITWTMADESMERNTFWLLKHIFHV